MVGNNNAVAGQQLLIVPASADHSATAVASAGDKDDNKDKANKALPQVGMDTNGRGQRQSNGRGQRQSNDHLALAWQDLAIANANAHGGRTAS
jgi:hypothetical protein